MLDTLMAGPSRPNHVWTPLLGNHDQMMEQALAAYLSALETWFANGAERTIASSGLDADEWHRIPSRYINFIRKLPALFQDEHRIFVHAGLRPDVPLAGQRLHDLLWIRDEFLKANYDFGKLIVHGHTPRTEPDYLPPFRLNLSDTGAAYPNGKLTVAVWDDGQAHPHFWQAAATSPTASEAVTRSYTDRLSFT